MASATRQTLSDIEIIVVDDASRDDSVARVAAASGRDARIRLLQNQSRQGPAAARNAALEVARGRWIAVLDSDDMMHPERLARLVDAAEAAALDIVADNQLVFHDDRSAPARALLSGRFAAVACSIDAADYVASNRLSGGGVPLGYLKPLFRRGFIESAGFRYDPMLRIAEDYDLVLRLLLAGARFRVYPQMTYFYRRHGSSISHRLSAATLAPMLEADARMRGTGATLPAAVLAELDRRRATITDAIAFCGLVAELKRHRWAAALRLIARRPRVAMLLRVPLLDRLRRWRDRRAPAPAARPGRRVCVVSRQRIVGRTNGSSAYLLSLCEALLRDGCTLDLLWVSPAMFGRRPVLVLQPEMAMFDTIRVHGGVRLGRLVIATNPMIALRALGAVIDRRLGLGLGWLARKAPHAIAVPLTSADQAFVATHARDPSLILADYAFLNEALAFALRPRAATAVVMHDLFCAQQAAGRPVVVDQCRELQLLGQADRVLAIQAEEAGFIERALGEDRVILAPMALDCVDAAQPGDGRTVLFVGSDTAPNLDALHWLLEEIWPVVADAAADARLLVAGTVCNAATSPRGDVRLLGCVADLAPLYREAAVLVSPLRQGSGLKIKLVEALAHGKAVVATETTLQGVKELAGGAVTQADDAAGFAESIVALLRDEPARIRRGVGALDVVRRHFAPSVCYRGLLEFARCATAPERPAPVRDGRDAAETRHSLSPVASA